MQRTLYQLKAGSLKNMKLIEEGLSALGPQEVSVQVKAIGLNFADVFAIWGLYKATPPGLFTPGLEYAGEIIAVGSEVTSVKVGDQVMGVTRFGAYATHLNIDHRYVIPLPEGWTHEEGAAYLVQVLTAYYGLQELGAIKEKQIVLIHSAAGGVGIWANRIAKAYNCFTIGTVGNQSKIQFCKDEGYDKVIVRGKDFPEKLSEALGELPLNLVMECIGGKILSQSYEATAPMGRVIVYGSAQYASPGNRPNLFRMIPLYLSRPRLDPQNMTAENKSVMAFNLIFLFEHADIMHKILTELQPLSLGKPYVGHVFPFNELPSAIRLFQTGKTMGKIIIQP
ncbi:MAG: zinc-binding dehydrogenase [Bacteroidota bacterium]